MEFMTKRLELFRECGGSKVNVEYQSKI